jgi:hypothetical protein
MSLPVALDVIQFTISLLGALDAIQLTVILLLFGRIFHIAHFPFEYFFVSVLMELQVMVTFSLLFLLHGLLMSVL